MRERGKRERGGDRETAERESMRVRRGTGIKIKSDEKRSERDRLSGGYYVFTQHHF